MENKSQRKGKKMEMSAANVRLPDGLVAVEYEFPNEFLGLRVRSHPDQRGPFKPGAKWPPKKGDLKVFHMRRIRLASVPRWYGNAVSVYNAMNKVKKHTGEPLADFEVAQALMAKPSVCPREWVGRTVYYMGTTLLRGADDRSAVENYLRPGLPELECVPYMKLTMNGTIKTGVTPLTEKWEDTHFIAYISST